MSALDRPLRAAILAAADSELVRAAVSRYGMRCGARRFVAGESDEEFLATARAANADGFTVACGILGEGIREPAEAQAVAERYCALLRAFAAQRIDANVAFKLTHVGLDLDPQVASDNAERIARAAEETGNTMRIDMEQSRYVDATLHIYRSLRERHANVGLVLQSYLYRSPTDLQALAALQPNVRVVKGAYLEPASAAYPHKRDVDEAYVKIVEASLESGGYTAIATHDAAIVARLERTIASLALPKRGRFEFQLLYGVATPLARELRDRGYRVRLAIPFGTDWFPYLMRRLAERPANLAFFLKGAFAGGIAAKGAR